MHSKKTILYLVTQSEAGGAQQYIFDLAANLKNEFNIFVAFGEQGEQGELAGRLRAEDIEFRAIQHLKRSISPINDFLALLEIIKLIKTIKPDIIHLNSSKISILGSIAAQLSKSKIENRHSKIAYTVHGWVFGEPMPFWKKNFYKFAEKFTAKFKDKLICVSEYDRQIALKEKIAAENKIITIHNGKKPINFLPRQIARARLSAQISNSLSNRAAVLCGETAAGQNFLSKEEAIKTIQSFKANLALPESERQFRIGAIGNLYKTKGFEYLIEAVKLVLRTEIKIQVFIIGEGEERENLEDLISQLNLKDYISLTGRINNAAELLPAFDLYICSSVKEGLSYTLLEAMQAGLPIIATDVGGNPELIENNKTGLLIESKNPQILAKKIYQLLNSSILRRELGEQAKQKVINEFSLENMLKKTREIYFSIL